MKYKLPYNSETEILFLEENMFAVQGYDIILIDQKMYDLHCEFIESTIHGFNNCHIIQINTSEKAKQLDNVFEVIKKIDSIISSREANIVAIGGGVIGDIAGFVASVIMRGVKYINIPTTLLAMVDSSFGGKNGANTKIGKNRIGTFYHPSKIIINLNFLESLSDREYNSSISEIIKAGFLDDEKLLKIIYRDFKLVLKREQIALKEIISSSLKVKAKFVVRDVRDESKRKLLNFGHSFAHAIETYSNYSFNHGESVALGMLIAIKFSIACGYCKEVILERFHEITNNFVDLDRSFEIFKSFDMAKIISLIQKDKKNSPSKLNLILIREIGDCFEEKNVDLNKLRIFLEKL